MSRFRRPSKLDPAALLRKAARNGHLLRDDRGNVLTVEEALDVRKGPARQRNSRYDHLFALARRKNADMPISEEPLRIWLPALRLVSTNRVLGSGKQKPQHSAKRAAQEAVCSYSGQLHRFDTLVDIQITQHLVNKARMVDADNLHAKHVIDTLVHIGVLKGDSPAHVRFVSKGNILDSQLGVEVLIALAEGSSHVL